MFPHVGQLRQCRDFSYINHQNGPRSDVSLHLGQNLVRWVHLQLTSLRANHLPGRYNTTVGTLSSSVVSAPRNGSPCLGKVCQGIDGLLHQAKELFVSYFSLVVRTSWPLSSQADVLSLKAFVCSSCTELLHEDCNCAVRETLLNTHKCPLCHKVGFSTNDGYLIV